MLLTFAQGAILLKKCDISNYVISQYICYKGSSGFCIVNDCICIIDMSYSFTPNERYMAKVIGLHCLNQYKHTLFTELVSSLKSRAESLTDASLSYRPAYI